MIKYCLDKWNKNYKRLESALASVENLNEVCDYKYLVAMIVKNILNDEGDYYQWAEDRITEIDDGNYQGTLLYMIPEDTYQPDECEYLMTFVGYGSCSGCDTLQGIKSYDWDDEPKASEKQLKAYMELCRDMVMHMIKPYNEGWREVEEFNTVVMK